jgi:hemerythrin
MFFEWNEELITGITDIDSQHKELFAQINRLLQECNHAGDRNAIGKYLGFLREYVAIHFSAEEREMNSQHYPGRAEHMAEHELFKQKLNHLCDSYSAQGANIQVVVMTIRASGDWLVSHINKTDKALAAFLKK